VDQVLRDMLITVAQNRQTITYSEVALSRGLDVRDPELARRLDEISTDEYNSERPLLSVVVVHQEGDRMPGEGFFRLARSLRIQSANIDNAIFFGVELQRCWEFWRNHRA
jgi:hypothetical protein